MSESAPRPIWWGCLFRTAQIFAILLIASAIALYVAYYFSTFEQRQLTSNLPEADRVEVQTLDTHFETIKGVVATTEVTGPKVQELMHIWHTQPYDYEGRMMCHEPAYRVRFFRSGSLITEATVCFHCRNIYFYKNGAAYQEAILGSVYSLVHNDRDAGSELHAFLDKLFPNPKDQPVHTDLP